MNAQHQIAETQTDIVARQNGNASIDYLFILYTSSEQNPRLQGLPVF